VRRLNLKRLNRWPKYSGRVRLFRAVHPKIPLNGRLVIIVDDGIATGATTYAAIQAVRAEKPQKLILAVPVAAEELYIALSAMWMS